MNQIDEHRIQIMALEYEMNPDKARKLLRKARDEPIAILKRNREYQMLVGGDTNGQKHSGAVHRCLRTDQGDGKRHPGTKPEESSSPGFCEGKQSGISIPATELSHRRQQGGGSRQDKPGIRGEAAEKAEERGRAYQDRSGGMAEHHPDEDAEDYQVPVF